MLSAVEGLYPLDGEAVGADTLDTGSHAYEELGELLEVGLAGCVVDRRDALG